MIYIYRSWFPHWTVPFLEVLALNSLFSCTQIYAAWPWRSVDVLLKYWIDMTSAFLIFVLCQDIWKHLEDYQFFNNCLHQQC
jgi:hypothetical protein